MKDSIMRIYQNGTYYYSCPYREPGAVCCELKEPCNRCGWNPAVEGRRKAAIREAMKRGDPDGWLLGSGSFSNVEKMA